MLSGPNNQSSFAELPPHPGPSILNHLTDSHHRIQDHEILLLNQAIIDDENLVSCLDTQLNDLDNLKTRLNDFYHRVSARKEEYINRIQRHQAAKAPWRKLPDELLAEIFVSRLDTEPQPPARQPWKLGHVCRRWRAVVQSNPQLWCRLPPIHWTPEIQQCHEKLVISALAASCELPLDVELVIARWYGNLTLETFHPFARKFNSFKTSMSLEDLCALSAMAQRFDNLKNLDLRLNYLMHDNAYLTPIPQGILKHCLALEHITLKISLRDARPFPFAQFSFPWSNLVSFFGAGFLASDIHLILEHATNLKECGFAFSMLYGMGGDHVRALPPITHEALTDIRINYQNQEFRIDELVSKLTVPHLLHLSLPSFQMETVHPGFFPFLRRSPNLTSVDLRSLTIDQHLMMAGLSHMQTISQLYIRFTPELFPFLTPGVCIKSADFPLLDSLFIEGMPTGGSPETSYLLLHNFVSSRTAGSLAVESGAVLPLGMLAVRFTGGKEEKYCRNIFYRLDGWKQYDTDWHSTWNWREFANSFLKKQVFNNADMLLLEALLIEIKKECDTLHPRYLRDRILIKTVGALHAKISVLHSAAEDESAVYDTKWEDAIQAHLHSPGWMSLREGDFQSPMVFYGKRNGRVSIGKKDISKWPFIGSILSPWTLVQLECI